MRFVDERGRELESGDICVLKDTSVQTYKIIGVEESAISPQPGQPAISRIVFQCRIEAYIPSAGQPQAVIPCFLVQKGEGSGNGPNKPHLIV